MKRLLLSLIGGFGIPFLYTLITGPLSTYIGHDRINYLLWIPIGWTRVIYFYFFPLFSNSEGIMGETGLFVTMIVGNVGLYGSLSYFFLSWHSLGRRKPNAGPPPPPSVFERPG